MYNPEELKETFERLEDGKPKIEGIRQAIEKADQNNDLPFMIYFRNRLCRQSVFHGDNLDLLVVFPEMLALLDKHPDIPVTRFTRNYKNAMEQVLWIYKWVLDDCASFYQISLEDCQRFFEDYKKRCIAYGYSLRPYYQSLYNFYIYIDREKAVEYFHEFEKAPRDENCNCKACERTVEIEFYLDEGNIAKADELSAVIDSYQLICSGNEKETARIRMLSDYMKYYMEQKELERANEYVRLLERKVDADDDELVMDDVMNCYAYINIGKALKIYKTYWKKWLEWRCPKDLFYINLNICNFFKELKKSRKRDTVKLDLDASFPLYKESNSYKIGELYDFYYKKCVEVADKFDARNGTNSFRNELKKKLDL